MPKVTSFALLCLWLIHVALALTPHDFVGQSLDNYEPDIEPYEDRLKPTKAILNYRRNGLKIDVHVVPVTNDTIIEDHFPEFPARDLSLCMLDLSMSCFRDRVSRFIDAIGRLDEITLWGSSVKFVKTKSLPKNAAERRMTNDADGGIGKIDRSIENLFDSFALRISLPRSSAKQERNQIDVMLDDTSVVEGRGKKGGGGGGGKGGGKCKKMMMMMMMMGKMKLMAWAGMMSMKGMMMSGMSLMISKAMLIMKLMSLKMGKGGGGGGGGGGGSGSGGGQLKEIVLLTKATGGAGGAPTDSYGAPPPSSYGPPTTGGGYDYSGGGGGGGWGRSFSNRVPIGSSANHSEIVYPAINLSNSYQNMDAILPIQPFNNSLIAKRKASFNDSTIWNSRKSWSSTGDAIQLDKPNIGRSSSISKNDELGDVEKKKPNLQKIFSRSIMTFMPTNYAKKWQNYEVADRIMSPGIRIVAVKRTSKVGRTSQSIPTGA